MKDPINTLLNRFETIVRSPESINYEADLFLLELAKQRLKSVKDELDQVKENIETIKFIMR